MQIKQRKDLWMTLLPNLPRKVGVATHHCLSIDLTPWVSIPLLPNFSSICVKRGNNFVHAALAPCLTGASLGL